MSNLGKWDRWYYGLEKNDPQAYGDTYTYQLGADFLRDCDLVEDWGCGKGWFSQFIPEGHYRGIDGSKTPWSPDKIDLVTYKSQVPGIFMRHVLEHNYEWKTILENALDSFTDRMVLVLFTPLVEETTELFFNEDPGVPDLAFSLDELVNLFKKHNVTFVYRTDESPTNYNEETVFFLKKEAV